MCAHFLPLGVYSFFQTKRWTADSTQNTDDWKKQLQSTETTTHATHTTHGTHATRAARATHAIFAIFIAAKTRFFFWKVWKGHPAVSRAPPHCTSASVFQTTPILFFLSLMKISLQPHTLFLNSWVRTFAKTPKIFMILTKTRSNLIYFFACFILLTRCTTSTSKKKLSTVRELSLSAFERC